jgi:hypothetical protein
MTTKRRVILVNYADDRFGHKGNPFRAAQRAMSESALAHGVDTVISWDWTMLSSTDLYRQRQCYFDRRYHLNGFVFKPFIVNHALQEMNYGDILIYYDAGDGSHLFDTDISPLVEICVTNNGALIHQWGDTNVKWTKRDCFHFMELDHPSAHNAIAMQATWFVLEKNEFTMRLTNEYLRYSLDERVASYQNDRVCGLPDLPGFVENRGDQSVLSLLAYKYGLRTFKGAGGQDNRVVGNFIRSLTFAGRCQIAAKQQVRRLAVKAGNLKHRLRRL